MGFEFLHEKLPFECLTNGIFPAITLFEHKERAGPCVIYMHVVG